MRSVSNDACLPGTFGRARKGHYPHMWLGCVLRHSTCSVAGRGWYYCLLRQLNGYIAAPDSCSTDQRQQQIVRTPRTGNPSHAAYQRVLLGDHWDLRGRPDSLGRRRERGKILLCLWSESNWKKKKIRKEITSGSVPHPCRLLAIPSSKFMNTLNL